MIPRIQRRLVRVGWLIEVDERRRKGLGWTAWRRVMLAPETWAAWVVRWRPG
jgi:hypothetical protein